LIVSLILRIGRVGVAAAVVAGLIGYGLERARFGPSDQSALSRVEAELRQRFDASATQRVVNRRLWGLGGYGEAHVGYFRDPRVMGDVAAALGASVDGGGRVKRPSWLYRRAFDIAVPLAMIALVLAGAAVTALFFYAFVWLTGTFMGWLVGLVWPAASPAAGHWWKVVMGWWAVVGWFLFTTKDGYNRSRTRHERRWRLRDDPPAN